MEKDQLINQSMQEAWQILDFPDLVKFIRDKSHTASVSELQQADHCSKPFPHLPQPCPVRLNADESSEMLGC